MHPKTLVADSRPGATVLHPDALKLADLLRPAWPAISDGIRRTGVPTCEVAEASLKEKLKRIEEDLDSARGERAEKAKARDEARETYAGSEDTSPDSPAFQAAEQAVRELGEVDDRIASLQGEQVMTLKLLGKDPEHASKSQGGRRDGRDDSPSVWNSAGLFASEDVRETLLRASTSKSRFGGMELGQVIDRDALAADVAPTSNMRRGEYFGVVPQIYRPLRVLDLLPTGTMDGNVLPYTQESGSFGAQEQLEGELKAEDGVTYTDATAVAQTIAAWLKIKKQALSDVPALQSVIDNRLRYSVRRRLEGQALNGNGTDPNIRGILQTSGIGAVAYAADELIADQVLRGLTTVLLADAQADGIVMNPTDWQTALIAKAAGDGHYYSGGPFSMTPQVMWGVPLIPSPAIPQGTVLVGDFAIGAQLFIREGVNVLLSDSDGDDFRRNRVTLLGEMRAALAVWRPAAFATVDLTA